MALNFEPELRDLDHCGDGGEEPHPTESSVAFPLSSTLRKKSQQSRGLVIRSIFLFQMLEAFLPKMKERRRGHVVAIASACGMVGAPNAVPYSVSKFGLRGNISH